MARTDDMNLFHAFETCFYFTCSAPSLLGSDLLRSYEINYPCDLLVSTLDHSDFCIDFISSVVQNTIYHLPLSSPRAAPLRPRAPPPSPSSPF